MAGLCRCLVSWLLALATAAGITIPIPSTTAIGTRNTGINNAGALIAARARDNEWTFYQGATARRSYVVRSDRAPLSTGLWAPNTPTSQWISAQRNATGSTAGCCVLPTTNVTQYVVASSFLIPAMTNPPNLAQWYLVMHGSVWGDDTITGYSLYSGTTPTGTALHSWTFGTNPTALIPQNFSLGVRVNPNQNYTLAFTLINTRGTHSGFRLEYSQKYVTPEPGSWALMMTCGFALAFGTNRRWRKASRSNDT
jgi:hypothetical protein